MTKYFMCSLCHNGILGGGLCIDDTAIIYKTNKLTVAPEYRKIVMLLNEIHEITWEKAILPIATFHMANGKEYKFLIFFKSSFIKSYQQITNS